MSEEQSMAVVRNYLEAGWKKHDLAGLDRFIAADHVTHGPMTDQLPAGIEGDRAFIGAMVTAFPDVHYTIDKQETVGDLVRTWITYHGTNTGSFMGLPPTGKHATVKVFTSDRVVNGKIVESWAEWDDKDMMRQLGMG